MDLLLGLVVLAVSGLVVGAFARLALPGRDPMTLLQTMLTGIAGSFLGGLIGFFLLGQTGGFLLSVICAAGIVYLVRRSRGGSLMEPGSRRRLRR